MKTLKQLVLGALAVAGAWCASANPVGVTVDGTDVSAGSGEGWTFAPAVMFNGITWLQCATTGLDEADWLDIGNGRYTEKDQSFFIQRIDFEHKLTPESFPEEATGSKTVRVILKE